MYKALATHTLQDLSADPGTRIEAIHVAWVTVTPVFLQEDGEWRQEIPQQLMSQLAWDTTAKG